MLEVNTIQIISQNLHKNKVWFPAKRQAIILDHQHECHDLTCKPAIDTFFLFIFAKMFARDGLYVVRQVRVCLGDKLSFQDKLWYIRVC